MFHYKLIPCLNDDLYKNIVLRDVLENSDEKIIKKKVIDENTGKCVGTKTYRGFAFRLKGDLKTYFLPSAYAYDNIFPFRIKDVKEVEYFSKVFNVIIDPTHIKVQPKEEMTGPEFFTKFCNFSHTNESDWFIMKIASVSAFAGNAHSRVMTRQGFGKGSVVNCIQNLTKIGANITISSKAKLEYLLKEHFINLDEIGGLAEAEKKEWTRTLLKVLAREPYYNKTTRATTGVGETIDISNLGVIITHNLPEYYVEQGLDPFEITFPPSVFYRVFPMFLEGAFQDVFETIVNPTEIYNTHKPELVKFIKHLLWIKDNFANFPLSFDLSRYDIRPLKGNENVIRWRETFNDLARMVEYAVSGDEEMFYAIMDGIYMSHKKYIHYIVENGWSPTN